MFVATALRVSGVDNVAVAVDEPRVLEIAKAHGIKAVLTSKDHQSGTDRINEAAQILGLNESEIIINVQADEPFIEPENIAKFRAFCEQNRQNAFMFSCYKKMDDEFADDKNLVKVVTDFEGYALYFSRSRIPFNRSECKSYKAHLGIYGYSVKSLKEFCTLATSSLENTEKLEQLRVLYNGERIHVELAKEVPAVGVDTAEDLEKVRAILAAN